MNQVSYSYQTTAGTLEKNVEITDIKHVDRCIANKLQQCTEQQGFLFVAILLNVLPIPLTVMSFIRACKHLAIFSLLHQGTVSRFLSAVSIQGIHSGGMGLKLL
jgi:hypothetical protein